MVGYLCDCFFICYVIFYLCVCGIIKDSVFDGKFFDQFI